MEEKEVVVEETTEEMEVQSSFNTDSLDVLVDGEDCTVENKEEVEENANEN
jgi:hypothetical protein